MQLEALGWISLTAGKEPPRARTVYTPAGRETV